MKETGSVRRIDDLERIVIPKEIRMTLRIQEKDPSRITLTLFDKFCVSIHSVTERIKGAVSLRQPEKEEKAVVRCRKALNNRLLCCII